MVSSDDFRWAGMVRKGSAFRGPFLRKRKPSMGLSFQTGSAVVDQA